MTKKESTDWIDGVEFEQASISDVIDMCLKCETKKEASELRERYRAYCTTPEVADKNLGYIFGYCNEEQRKKLYSLFPVIHLMFGVSFGREGEDICGIDTVPIIQAQKKEI